MQFNTEILKDTKPVIPGKRDLNPFLIWVYQEIKLNPPIPIQATQVAVTFHCFSVSSSPDENHYKFFRVLPILEFANMSLKIFHSFPPYLLHQKKVFPGQVQD